MMIMWYIVDIGGVLDFLINILTNARLYLLLLNDLSCDNFVINASSITKAKTKIQNENFFSL